METPPISLVAPPIESAVPPVEAGVPFALLPPKFPSWLAKETLDVELEDSSSDEDIHGIPKPAPRIPKKDFNDRIRPQPSYYFDPDYDTVTATESRKRGRRGGLKGIPVFEPTMAEFAEEGGFYGYVKRIEKYGMRSGVVKVIPPKEWVAALPSTAVPLEAIRMKEPIEQHMVGSQGLYRVQNVQRTRIFNPAQWKATSETPKYAGPDFIGDKAKGDRSERSTKGVKPIPKRSKPRKSSAALTPEDADTEEITIKKESTPSLEDTIMASASPIASTSNLASTPTLTAGDSPYNPVNGSSTKKRKPSMAQRAEPTQEEWDTFVQLFEDLPHGIKREEYTNELLRDIERRYWRTLTVGEPPMYGADMAGSLFTSQTKAWNVASLGDLLPRLAPSTCKIPGVVSPYLYFGMWRATFAWHVEDADLYSINYIHFGAPKFWYSVPQEMSAKFERVMAGLFPTDRTKCSQFLRHKEFLASPRVLANHGITLNRVVQFSGEFILTYPKGYHSGFNLGFNAAESVNFATETWLPLGKVAKPCVCIGDSVNINVDAWLQEAAYREYGKPLSPQVARRKRVLSENTLSPAEELEPRKRSKPLGFDSGSSMSPSIAPKREKKIKKEVILVRDEDYACCLCPNMTEEGLVALESSNQRAHRVCVMFTPATWIALDESGAEVVRGYDGIEKERWELKCSLCSVRYGCKVQCTKGTCSKSFHLSCALAEGSGIAIDALAREGGVLKSILDITRAENEVGENLTEKVVSNAPIPMEGDGAITLLVLCRTHNPEYIKESNARRALELKTKVEAIEIGSRIRARTKLGVLDVTLLAVLADTLAIQIEFDDGQKAEIKFKGIIWPESASIIEKKRIAAVAKARDGQIWIYDDDVRSSDSLTASVTIPAPYSNYYPSSLHVSNVPRAPIPTLIRSQLPGSFANVETMENPYQPHVFDYGTTNSSAILSASPHLRQSPPYPPPHSLNGNGITNGNGHGPVILPFNGASRNHSYNGNNHSNPHQLPELSRNQSFPKYHSPYPIPPTSNNNTLPSINSLLQHTFDHPGLPKRRMSASAGSIDLSSFELARRGSAEARARAVAPPGLNT